MSCHASVYAGLACCHGTRPSWSDVTARVWDRSSVNSINRRNKSKNKVDDDEQQL
jgi:hypothetical protein